MKLTNADKLLIADILRSISEQQDHVALISTDILARLRIAEPDNPLTLAMTTGVREIEADCANLQRLAAMFEKDIEDASL